MLFFLLLFLAFTVPIGLIFLLNKILKKKLRNGILRKSIAIIIGISITLYGYNLLLDYLVFSPIITKKINEDYYFTQQDYGMAWGSWGKHFDFYKKRKFWFDKKMGHIHWHEGSGEADAKFNNEKQSKNEELILTEGNEIELDTILNFEKPFDFEFYTKFETK